MLGFLGIAINKRAIKLVRAARANKVRTAAIVQAQALAQIAPNGMEIAARTAQGAFGPQQLNQVIAIETAPLFRGKNRQQNNGLLALEAARIKRARTDIRREAAPQVHTQMRNGDDMVIPGRFPVPRLFLRGRLLQAAQRMRNIPMQLLGKSRAGKSQRGGQRIGKLLLE